MNIRYFVFLFITWLITACASQPTTGLNERGTHTGTLSLLRVDDTWAPDYITDTEGDKKNDPTNWRKASTDTPPEGYRQTNDITQETFRCGRRVGADPAHCDPIRRFVRVRYKDDIEGLDGSEYLVLPSQKAIVTINYSFIKYFKEFGGESRQGEIAMILSFESGKDKRDSFLVHSSEGQTLGSFLGAQDWKAIGPIEIDGPALNVRMVIIEVDQSENERLKQYLRTAATTVATVVPEVGSVVPIATSVANFIVGQNTDDVVLDQRFTLARFDENSTFHSAPLLYGKYILMLQEDRLARTGAAEAARFSTQPPEVNRFRYDLDSDRLFLAYNYQVPEFPNPAKPPNGNDILVPAGNYDYHEENEFGPTRVPFFHTTKKAEEIFSVCDVETQIKVIAAAAAEGSSIRDFGYEYARDIDSEKSKNVRRRVLGYRFDGALRDMGAFTCSYERALAQIVIDAARYTGSKKFSTNKNPELELLETALKNSGGRFGFDYPVEKYPQAQTLLAQYPFHTHVVFSVDRVYGEGGTPYHEGFPDYQTYLESEIESARSKDELVAITESMSNSIAALKQRKLAFRHLKALPNDATAKDKVCVLFNALQPSNSSVSLGNAEILDEILIVSDKFFSDPYDVMTYLKDATDGGPKSANNKSGFECNNN